MKGKTISHYKILERLGGGGMGEVYKAEDIRLKRIVALKFLPVYFSRDEGAKRRFIQEAQTASSLDHPNICTIFEIDESKDLPGETGGRLFIAMAFYKGETLKKRIRPRLLSQSNAIEIAIQVAKGLAKAHKQGIIHRDVKPANVMITEDGTAKIVDFGLARLAGKSGITRPEITMGTLSYISPEQIQGKKIDHRTDIWSFGVLLYELLTGELPFKGEIDQAVIYSILNEAPEPFKVTISQQLQRIVNKALEKNLEDRYLNMEEVIGELQDIEKEDIKIKAEKVRPSIAVLPFRNMSNDESQEYFCDGIAEEIINALTTVQGLRVVARTSSFSFKGKQVEIREIGRKLNVKMILEGSVRRSDNKLRITAQLINVADGYHLWSEKYDRTLKDVFAIQDEISLSIVDKLRIDLLEKEKTKLTKRYTENLEAYNLFLMGRFFRNKNTFEDLNKAINYYKQAINKDPDYSAAYAEMSVCYSLLAIYYYKPSKEVCPKASEAASRAIEIDSTVSEAHHAMGLVELFYNWNWENSRREFERAIKLYPEYGFPYSGYAAYFETTGQINNAIAEEEKVLEHNPLSVMGNLHLAFYLLRARHFERAREYLGKVLELVPKHIWAHWFIGQTYALESRFNESFREYKLALELSKSYSTTHATVLAGLGWVQAKSGNRKEAQRILIELKKKSKKEFVIPFVFVKLYSALGNKEEAFAWLNKAHNDRDIAMVQILTDETIDNLRSDPRYIELLKKMNLYKYYKQIT
jgi:serine/threonine protein kinase/Tfp pilus assembly protein PilF